MIKYINKLNGWWRAWLAGTIFWLIYSGYQFNASVIESQLSANAINYRYAAYGWSTKAIPDYSDAYSWIWIGFGIPIATIVVAYTIRWVIQGFRAPKSTQ